MPGTVLHVGSPSSPATGMPQPGIGSMAPSAPPKDEAAWLTDIRNGITLGDLHVKQQKYPEAVAAYKDAEMHLKWAMQSRKEKNPEDMGSFLTGAHLYLLLAKGFESAGDNDMARKMMDNVAWWSKVVAAQTGEAATAKAAAPTPPALPSKLVVTASKKLLDEVGSGKMTFEAFRKAATVEYVTPLAADKK